MVVVEDHIEGKMLLNKSNFVPDKKSLFDRTYKPKVISFLTYNQFCMDSSLSMPHHVEFSKKYTTSGESDTHWHFWRVHPPFWLLASFLCYFGLKKQVLKLTLQSYSNTTKVFKSYFSLKTPKINQSKQALRLKTDTSY